MTDKEKLQEILDILTIDVPNGFDTFSALGRIIEICED